jgi:hypothetical protein
VIGIFKNSHPSNNFILFIYGLILRWPSFVHPIRPEVGKGDAFICQMVASSMNHVFSFNAYLFSFILFAMVFLQAILINNMVNAQKLFHRPNDFSGMVFLLFTAVMPGWFEFTPGFLLALIVTWILTIIFKFSANNESRSQSFNAGFVLGLGVMIYSPAVVFLFLLLIALILLRAFKPQEWVLVFLGLVTPLYFVLSYLYLKSMPLSLMIPQITLGIQKPDYSVYQIIGLSTVFLLILVGLGFSQSNSRKLLVQSRNCWSVLFIAVIISSFLPFFNTHSLSNTLMPFVVSGSVFAAASFYYPERKWFSVFSHLLLWTIAIINGYFFAFH